MTGGEITVRKIQELFNAILRTEIVPKDWKNAIVTLILKKGDKKETSIIWSFFCLLYA